MKKIISYILWGNEPRYWCNISYILVSNSVIYPEFISRFYVHKDSMDNPAFLMLQEAAKLSPNVEIEIIENSYQGTQLTVWRMKPLWEDGIDFLFCRDLDHITNALERKAVQYFIDNERYLIHSIRSYHLHSTPYLAGLCGFRSQKVLEKIRGLASSFEKYCEWGQKCVKYCKDWIWGCDQALLRDFFGKAGLYPLSLDCPQYTAVHQVAGYNCNTVLPSDYDSIILPNCNIDCLFYSDSIAPSFTGQPVTATTDQIKEMMRKTNNIMSEVVSPYV